MSSMESLNAKWGELYDISLTTQRPSQQRKEEESRAYMDDKWKSSNFLREEFKEGVKNLEDIVHELRSGPDVPGLGNYIHYDTAEGLTVVAESIRAFLEFDLALIKSRDLTQTAAVTTAGTAGPEIAKGFDLAIDTFVSTLAVIQKGPFTSPGAREMTEAAYRKASAMAFKLKTMKKGTPDDRETIWCSLVTDNSFRCGSEREIELANQPNGFTTPRPVRTCQHEDFYHSYHDDPPCYEEVPVQQQTTEQPSEQMSEQKSEQVSEQKVQQTSQQTSQPPTDNHRTKHRGLRGVFSSLYSALSLQSDVTGVGPAAKTNESFKAKED
ncbi:hypothetical protein CDD80_2496 [Ophiocordyceps camponoti-rufipedis]|uniref:Uncharacterized protein n=1 Tax=Ophiocordyceps camponoti-rufipedis TaxID=2004952 RepID=A0A2C5XK82_9HYPO|nr:hypothetical protein CDD80_2496 [Ophiocordyceps camponoti-rufipedis]